MWTCRNCATRCDVDLEICPVCGAVAFEVEASDGPPAPWPSSGPEAESPTEYDVPAFPDPGPAIVECYIGVSREEAASLAERLRDDGIPAMLAPDDPGAGPAHRVRVPIADLGRALAAIDSIHKRRAAPR